jgi:hypothetical protein
MGNMHLYLKDPVTMNSIFFGTIIFSTQSIINPIGSSPRMFTNSDSGSVCKFFHKPRLIKFFILGIHSIHCVQDIYRSRHDNLSEHEEGYTQWKDQKTPTPKRLGFIFAQNRHPKDERDIFPSPARTMTSHRTGLGKEETAKEERKVEALSPQQRIP